ncbi:hypothetical protein ZWY2020_048850 [Hordeum vulgare]|nr:hypothetical protein ZWY2020_048850 [Hordeum vulgare]
MSSVDAAGNPLRAFTSPTSLLFRTLGLAASPPVHWALPWILVQLLNPTGCLGQVHKGAGCLAYSTNLAILCLYTRLSGACRRTWTGFMEAFAFKELRQYAELAVPSAMMVCLNTGTLMFTVPSGLYAAISTHVSNELGAVRKGERLVPAGTLDLFMRCTFPVPNARVKATERFEAAYPIIKEPALVDNAELAKEATDVFIWCLTQSPDSYKQWDKLHAENIKASVAVLRKIITTEDALTQAEL